MTLRLRSIFFIVVGLLTLWFLYLERGILTPFILAAIFAYIFNPVVNFFSHRLRLPRALAVLIIYLAIVLVVAMAGMAFSSRVVEESVELRKEATVITKTAKAQINTLPEWLKPAVNDTLSSFENGTVISYPTVLSFLPTAFSRILSFIIFLFAAFYFLKEGRSMFDKLLNFIPNDYKVEVDILIRRINAILSGYLRGQIFLVVLVSLVLFICLSILGVKFALILAVFSGFAEIVPIIGPIVAASVAALAAYIGGNSNFSLSPLQIALVVVAIYTVVRQLQDYLVNPYIMGRITKLHPLIILFAVISGEHIAGVIGLILAVPIAGVIRIIFEYSLDKINTQTTPLKKP
jgi:predicted PurR-regulated permease PerM